MQFYNRKAVFGGDAATMAAELDEAYEWGILVGHRGDAARCVACGVCEEACTQRLAIMARLKDISSWERVDKPDEM
jgi:predicted aldo/keto reductase-like oxidoreductase